MENGIGRKPQFSDRHDEVCSPTVFGSVPPRQRGPSGKPHSLGRCCAVRPLRLHQPLHQQRTAQQRLAHPRHRHGPRRRPDHSERRQRARQRRRPELHLAGPRGTCSSARSPARWCTTCRSSEATSALYISSNGSSGLDKLAAKRRDTDEAIGSLTRWVGRESDGEQFASRQVFHQSIRDFRKLVTAVNVTVLENLAFYTADIDTIIGWLADSIQQSQSRRLWPVLVSYHMLGHQQGTGGLGEGAGKYLLPRKVS